MQPSFRIGIIRVLTEEQENVELHGRLLERWFPAFETISRCIPDQPTGIHDEETKAIAIPKIIALADEMAREEIDGLIVSCADDPAVVELHTRLSIPVVGAGASTAAAASRFGDTVYVLGITEDVPASYPRGLGAKYAGNVVPAGVRSTLDLRTDEGRTSTVATARILRDKGADAIALACTGLATIGIAPMLERETGIPVLDPVLCEGHALLLDLMRRSAVEDLADALH